MSVRNIAALMLFAGVFSVSAAQNSASDIYQQGLAKETRGDLKGAIETFEGLVARFSSSDRAVVARALVQLGSWYELLGEESRDKALNAYRLVLSEYGDISSSTRLARTRLATLAPAAPPAGASSAAGEALPLARSTIFVAAFDPGRWTVSGTRAERVTNNSAVADMTPKWSPDGRHLAFRRITPQTNGATLALQSTVGWSQLAAALRPYTSQTKYVVRTLDSGAEDQSPSSGELSSRLTFLWLHRDNTLLVPGQVLEIGRIVGFRELSNGVHVVASRDELAEMAAAGITNRPRARILFVGSDEMDTCNAISLDDETLFCAGLRRGLSGRARNLDGILLVSVTKWQGKGKLELPVLPDNDKTDIGFLSMSPDGSTLAFFRGSKTEPRLVRIAADSEPGNARFYEEVLTASGRVGRPVWTNDGRWILFAHSTDGEKWRILRVPEHGGEILFTGLEVTNLSWFELSPDGTKIAFDGTDYAIASPVPFTMPSPSSAVNNQD